MSITLTGEIDMRRLALLLALAMAPALHAQAPEPGPGPRPNPGRDGRPGGPPPFVRGPAFGRGMRAPGGPPGDIGSFLLAHTAELKLSDQQVTRLAAIARRSGDRRQAAMRAMDSLATRRMRGDSAGRGPGGGPGGPPPATRVESERQREQRHLELREALGVLTPDQQATAWELGRGF
ncbi:MAG: hypothetical protein ACJ79A_13065 [Gemmatimonadaceae bacterium]